MILLTLRVFFACLFVCFTFLQFLSLAPFLPLADDVVSIFGPPKKLSKHSVNFFDLYLRTLGPKTSSSVIVTAHPGLMGFFFFLSFGPYPTLFPETHWSVKHKRIKGFAVSLMAQTVTLPSYFCLRQVLIKLAPSRLMLGCVCVCLCLRVDSHSSFLKQTGGRACLPLEEAPPYNCEPVRRHYGRGPGC